MSELRVEHLNPGNERTAAVSREGGSASHGDGGGLPRREDRRAGAEELAVALAESDRGDTLSASFEVGTDGEPLIRIVDRARRETVALITPEELKTLAEDTGLPPGLLMQVSS